MSYISHVYLGEMLWYSSNFLLKKVEFQFLLKLSIFLCFVNLDSLSLSLSKWENTMEVLIFLLKWVIAQRQTQKIVTHSVDWNFFDETKTSVKKFGEACLTIIRLVTRLGTPSRLKYSRIPVLFGDFVQATEHDG